ncbi:MAG: polyamine aminopropyltransferase [Gammaproteobacteria bacterium]|nr:polyamine aminopropyltransferase [Gammaproteobacteria bacterium]
MSLDETWFSEPCNAGGSAISFKIKKKLHEEQSEYQKLEVFETEKFGRLMVIDGFIMLTQRDNFLYHEMMSHPCLFTHPNPEKVLIIGGGDCGTAKEVLKHDSVKVLHQVEIDERVTRIAEVYFPELCESNSDPRAEFHFVDGIKWVEDAESGFYDVIIIDSTDPIGPAEGLFSLPFYQQCFKALGRNGILVQQSESPLIHMSILKNMHHDMRGAGFIDSATLFFPQSCYPTGWWSATMCCKDNTLSDFREQDADSKSFDTQYYNAKVHQAALCAPEFFYKALAL